MAKVEQYVALERREILMILAGLMLAMLLAALDQTIVATAMPTIGRDLADVEHLPWIVTAYLLAATATTPLYGALSDIYGRRRILLISISLFLIGSIFCALAPTMILLVLARALQGAGGGGLLSLAQTIMADILPPRDRARYQIYIAAVFMTASVAGPVLGGFFAEHLHWTMIFWINLPIGVAAFFMTYRQLRRLPRHERFRKLDIVGASLLVAATTSLLVTLNWGGMRYAWTSFEILSCFAGSAFFWVGFFFWLKRAPEPLIPLSLLSNRVILSAVVSASCSLGLLIGLTIYMPMYFESIAGLSASQSGLALLPLMIGTVCGATISGRFMIHLQHYKRVPVIGLVFAFAATMLFVFLPAKLPILGAALLLAVISLGLGTVLSVSTISIQNAAPLHQLGTALSTANLFRQLAGALVVAVFGVVIIGGSHMGGDVGGLHAHLHATQREGADFAHLVSAFRLLFILAALMIAIDLLAIVTMEERPLIDHMRREPAETPSLGE